MGIVDLSAYDAANSSERFNNLALPLNFSWQSGCAIADEFEKIFKQKTAKEWERECCEAKMACADVISFKEWFADDETRKAKIVADVEGEPFCNICGSILHYFEATWTVIAAK